MGPSNLLPQDNFNAHQDLLKGMASNLGLEVEELRETLHSLIDILAAAAPAKVALPINEAMIGPVKALWQTPPSLSPHIKKSREEVLCDSKRV